MKAFGGLSRSCHRLTTRPFCSIETRSIPFSRIYFRTIRLTRLFLRNKQSNSNGLRMTKATSNELAMGVGSSPRAHIDGLPPALERGLSLLQLFVGRPA